MKDPATIEEDIYEKAQADSGFAIAYALIQVSAALNSIGDQMTDMVVTLQKGKE